MTSATQSLERIISPPGHQVKYEANQTHLRLYQHQLCPFASRARYAFLLKNVPIQLVEMDLNEKAKWHVDFNGGMVPVLETRPDELIKESGIAAQFACEVAGPD